MTFKSRNLLPLLNISLLVMAIVSALLLARDFISITYRGAAKGKAAQSDGKAADRQLARGLFDYAPVMSNNPFGFPAGELRPLERAQPGEAAVAVSVNIKLMGVVAWPKGRGYAFIADNASGSQSVYKTGEEIPGYGTLKSVEESGITVSVGGKDVRVPMEEIASAKEIMRPAPAATSANGFAKKSDDGSYIVDQKALQTALDNPKQIMTDARLLPNMVDGKQDGFVIREIKKGGVYENLGLRNGDVLLRVNDFDVSDPETALQAFTALRGMDRVDLDIMRGGSKMTLTYMIR